MSIEEDSQKGIVYIGRIPPRMSPGQIKSLLERYAAVDRIYLAPNKNKSSSFSFSEGWIEFLDKQKAKQVVSLLNGQPMGGGRGSKKTFSHDLWCLKYLSKFKWVHLSEKLAYERAVREQKLHSEITQTKRENELYLKGVGKNAKNKKQEGNPTETIPEEKVVNDEQFEMLRKRFKQRKIC